MAPLPAVTLPLIPDPAPLVDLLDVFIKHNIALRDELAELDNRPALDVASVRDDNRAVHWAQVTIDGKTTQVCTDVYDRITALVNDCCAAGANTHDMGVRIGWEMTRREWDSLRSVLIANAHVAYIRALLEAGKLDR